MSERTYDVKTQKNHGLSRHRPTVATVDLGRIASNFLRLKNTAARGAFVCPMVKANAYGHGDVQVAKRLRRAGAEHLGVGLIEEGLRLRQNGDRGSVLHFGMFDLAGAEAMVENKITAVISSREALEDWITVAQNESAAGRLFEPLTFHLKINTGMNRLGFAMKDVSTVAKRLAEVSGVVAGSKPLVKLVGIATHLSDGDDFGVAGGRSDEQLKRFRKAERELRDAGLSDFLLHIANSSAVRALASLRKNSAASPYDDLGIRPGLATYGVEPDAKAGGLLGVLPVLALTSRIIHLQDVRQGERVSYGGHWQAPRNSRIGVIPCGYADGYRRGLNVAVGDGSRQASGNFVIIEGRRAPAVGTICMDYFMCDLTEVQTANVGTDVILIGSSGDLTARGVSITAADLAARVQTIPYEILTGISDRVPRLYVDDEASVGVISEE